MTVLDIALMAALVGFVAAWWMPDSSLRRPLLWSAGFAGLTVGIWDVADDRWQAGAGVLVSVIFLLTLLLVKLFDRRSMGRRSALPYVSGTIFAVAAAAAAGALWMFPIRDIPPPSGPFPVGVRTFELSDENRPGVFSAAADEPRRLLVRTWYPADPPKGARRARYFSEAEADTTARGLSLLTGFPRFLSYIKHARTNSYKDAPLRAGATDLPVIIYSHGYMSFLGQNTALMEELASNGYAVYAIQHTGDSSAAIFPNGDVVSMDPALLEDLASGEGFSEAALAILTGTSYDTRLQGHLESLAEMKAEGARIVTQSAGIWVEDLRFVLNQLESGRVPAGVAEIAAASDFTKTGQIGMSFGGSAAGGFCRVDPRCAAGVNLDGMNYHYAAFASTMPVPFMMVHSDLDKFYRAMTGEAHEHSPGFNEFSYEGFDVSGQSGHVYRIQVRGAAHLGFSDLSLFVRRPLRDAFLGSTPSDTLIAVQNDLVRGFFDRHLQGQDSGFPDAQYNQYRDWLMPADTAGVREWWLAKSPEDRAAIEAQIAALRPAP